MSADSTRSVGFSLEDVEKASEEWNFNCGPAALCAVLGLTPAQARPHLLDFESKGYTNPFLMGRILHGFGAVRRPFLRNDRPWPGPLTCPCVEAGLMRVQWGGPWTKPGVPMRVRYRKTHWVALAGDDVFDINAMNVGGWVAWDVWAEQLVPWLIKECQPDGDGTWWPTHGWEVSYKWGPEA
jgi:hypothetical protein